jgi:predicted nucleotidyltransferase
MYNSGKTQRKGSWMTNKLLAILRKKLATEEAIRFAYLFGSQVREDIGKLSDIDVAVFLQSDTDHLYYRLKLIENVAREIKAQKVDIVVLNGAPPVLSHQVVKTGIVVKESKEDRIDFEMELLREYLDTEHLRNTQVLYIREHLKTGTYFG